MNPYRINGEKHFSIAEANTTPIRDLDKGESKDVIKDVIKELSEYQEKLFAGEERSVLVVFQAMDAAGKDGTIERLLTGLNPQGIRVYGFKAPTSEERGHDFIWRVHQKAPKKGMIHVFNRSHYEEVLVTRVHPKFILGQNIPSIKSVSDIGPEFWNQRFESIRAFEKLLADNGTVIVKFFLHVSQEEQKDRMEDRMSNPEKHWKFNIGDIHERQHWSQYMQAYEEAINATAADHAPWYAVPADDKPSMRAIVLDAVLEELKKHPVNFPNASESLEADIAEAKEMFKKETTS